MRDFNQFAGRKYVIGGLLILGALICIIRLFSIQVVDKTYRLSASNNVLRYVTQYPARGLIYDRNHQLIVSNEATYDLMIIPSQVPAFDTSEFCNILNIPKDKLRKEIRKASDYSMLKASILLKQLSAKTYALLSEKLYKFSGFYVQPRTIRHYTCPIAAHMLGYVGEATENIIKSDSYYKLGDYIGISGIEKSYEKELRGKKGVNIFLVDVHNSIKGSYQNGRYDTAAVVGENLTATFDKNLQEYGEYLMNNKTGSIVAIEPSTGEILCMVSAPGYSPSRLVGRKRSKYFPALMKDTLKPLFNRAIMASYPPGSTFKVVNALIGLQEKVLYPSYMYSCAPGYYAQGVYVKCHIHRTPLDLIGAIQNSCNAYFCHVFRNILDDPKFPTIYQSFANWKQHLESFGFGHKLGCDLPNELNGFLPDTSYYDRYYHKNGWGSLTLISMAIGQGELGLTPVQMANLAATIANRGYYYIPHVIKEIEGKTSIDAAFRIKHRIDIDSIYFNVVIKGMDLVVNGELGTGSTARIAHINDIRICGKTGTAQNPHGKDHSIFMAFAPKDNPKIAISVYVENAGFGSTYAAPIASLMIEKYLRGKIIRPWLEEYIRKTDLIHGNKKK